MRDYDSYLNEAKQILSGSGAFVKKDRGDALLITNAPRLNTDKLIIEELKQSFEVSEYNGLLRLVPRSEFTKDLSEIYCAFIKKKPDTDKRIRQRLALALRNKNNNEADALKKLIEEEDYEA